MLLNKNYFSFKKPQIMGICNVTIDSFSDGGKNFKTQDATKNINLMHKQGATIIDIGAESTRPGSEPISYQQEIKKLAPILKKIPKDKFIISIDTNKIETQEFALQQGAHIINDIFGGSEDLFYLSKKYNNGLILMHTPAPPKTMQSMTHIYRNVVEDIKNIFKIKANLLNKYKISSNKVWFDPGIGFGKNLKQNLSLLKNIKKLKIEKYGLLLGSSRKSWISRIDKSKDNERLGGSLASVLYCLEQGVDIFRVHDVKETYQAIKIYKEIQCSK
jgi:dihydropteroate synthase